MSARISGCVLAVAAMLATPAAASADDRHSVTAIATIGKSLSTDRRMDNLAPPAVELRYGFAPPSQPLVRLTAGLAIIVFPEHIPELRLGARIYAVRAFTGAPVVRDLFVGGNLQTLLSIDGFDVAPNLELGIAVERGRLVGMLALGVSRYLRGPRLVREARIGVGFTF